MIAAGVAIKLWPVPAKVEKLAAEHAAVAESLKLHQLRQDYEMKDIVKTLNNIDASQNAMRRAFRVDITPQDTVRGMIRRQP
jgi:hypothetical protein